MNQRNTVLLCYNCIPKNKYCYRIGGTFTPEKCQKCGKYDHLGEYVINCSANKFLKQKDISKYIEE